MRKFLIVTSLFFSISNVFAEQEQLLLRECIVDSQESKAVCNEYNSPLFRMTYVDNELTLEEDGAPYMGISKVKNFVVNNNQCKTNFKLLYPSREASIMPVKVKVENSCDLKTVSFKYDIFPHIIYVTFIR